MTSIRSAVACLVTLTLAPALAATQVPDRSTVLGLRVGVITPGAFYLEEGPYESYDLSLSFSGGISVDYRVAPKLYVGVFTDVMSMNAFDETALYYEGGITIKALIASPERAVSFRPMFAIGAGNLGAIYTFEDTQYLTLKLGSEILFRSFFIEALAYGAPTGGNADVTTYFGPVALVRFGKLF